VQFHALITFVEAKSSCTRRTGAL
jgi:hypothetical protein